MSKWLTLIVVGALLCTPFCYAADPVKASDAQVLRFGVIPFIPPGVLAYRFHSLAQGLQQTLGQPVQLETRLSYEIYRQALEEQAFDIALVQPWDYIAIRENGYSGVVQKREPLRAAFITLDDSVNNLGQLKNKTIAFPDKMAAVTLSAKQQLRNEGLREDDYQSFYLSDHQSCILAVASRSANACVVGADYNQTSIEQAGRRYRIFAYGNWIPPILIVVGSRLLDKREQLIHWFLNLEDSEFGRAILDDAYLDRVIVVRDEEYVEWFETLQ